MYLRRVLVALVIFLATSLAAAEAPARATIITGPALEEVTVVSGLVEASTFAFAPDGRIFIVEKPGVVRVFKDGALLPAPLIDIQDRVNSFWFRGLLGLAIDPDFFSNGYVYLLYTYEHDPDDYEGPKTARLTRVTVVGDEASPDTEVVILGTVSGAPCGDFPPGADCIPGDAQHHTASDIRFAAGGTLFVTIGDAAPNAVEELSLRAQDLDSLAGKVLHINPDGTGVAGNPFWNGDPNANRSKVWARGLRNPFRLTVRPDTGIPYLGDVGWAGWEEINVVRSGANLGWPCYEGVGHQLDYEPDPVCQALYLLEPGAVTPPLYAYPTPPSGSVTGGDFATTYSGPQAGAYFFGDWARSWIKYMTVNDDDELIAIQDFATSADGPVAFKTGLDGEIYYLAYNEGELRHIQKASPVGGAAELPEVAGTPMETDGSSGGSTAVLAGTASAMALALAVATWYARRRLQ